MRLAGIDFRLEVVHANTEVHVQGFPGLHEEAAETSFLLLLNLPSAHVCGLKRNPCGQPVMLKLKSKWRPDWRIPQADQTL